MHSHRQRPSVWSLLVVTAIVLASGSVRSAGSAPLTVHETATLIRVIDTSRWSPPSPDPSGITYWAQRDHLVTVDGEVEEMNIWAGANVFESTRAGSLVRTYNTTSWNKEPVGIDIDIAANGHWFVSNDSQQTIFDIDLGADGEFGTPDDRRRPFLTSGFGNGDPEGLSLGAGKLYTVDGAGSQIYITSDGGNGIFEASDPTTSFDTGVLGIADPEGIDYDPRTGNLWIIDRRNDSLSEVTTSGRLIQSIDLAALVGATNPADVTLAPGSNNSAEQHLYIVERGVDNNVDPNENDGKIYEISITAAPPPPPPGANLLLNPGFELDANNDGKPDNWSTHSQFTRSASAAHSGSYSGRFFAADNSGATIKQAINNIFAGTTYNLGGWVNIPPTGDTFSFRLKVRWRDASNNALRTDTLQSFTGSTGGAWTQVARSATSPAGTVRAEVLLVTSNLNATIYVDDFGFNQ
ncbi:MAG TPA: SdiA-regulated domain-containing protein [Herpetosiphonaceae bacterium]